MSIKASDYRTAGRYAAQDKARREHRKQIDKLEDAAREAYAAWRDAIDDEDLYAATRAADAALLEVDPTNSYFS